VTEFTQDITAQLPQLRTVYRAAAARALTAASDHILGESNDQAPIERGMRGGLISTGQATVDSQDLRAAISYDADHAVPQHEDMSYHHDSGRRAKFLELAMADNSDIVAQMIARAIRNGVGA
jgi:hypothetical protein